MRQNRLSHNNPLARWVSRHTALSTVFPATGTGSERPLANSGSLIAGAGPGVIYPIAAEKNEHVISAMDQAEPDVSSNTQGAAVQRQSILSTASTPHATRPVQDTPLSPSKPQLVPTTPSEDMPVQRKALPKAAPTVPTMPSVNAAQPQTAARANEESTTSSTEWRRLQAILRKHETGQTESSSAHVEQPPASAPPHGSVSSIPPPDENTSIPSGQKTIVSQTAVQRSPMKRRAEVTYVEPEGQRAETNEPAASTEPQPPTVEHASEIPSPSATEFEEAMISSVATPAENPIRRETTAPPTQPSLDATAVQRSPLEDKTHGIQNGSGATLEQTTGDIPKTVAPESDSSVSARGTRTTDIPPHVSTMSVDEIQPAPSNEPHIYAADAKESEQTISSPHSVPLQDAWPVRRLDVPEVTTAQPLPAEESFNYAPGPIPTHPTMIDGPQQTVVSPQAQEQLSNPQMSEPHQTNTAQPPRVSSSAATIQRKPISESEMTSFIQKKSPEPTPVVPSEDIPPASYVETSVGPLPADLWTILDKQPPRATTSHHSSSVPTQPGTIAGPFPSTSPTTSTIQRQPMESAPETQTQSATPASTATAPETTTTNASPDIEGIARQVYAILRRRLITEWERMRR